jgi:hypothetical protein
MSNGNVKREKDGSLFLLMQPPPLKLALFVFYITLYRSANSQQSVTTDVFSQGIIIPSYIQEAVSICLFGKNEIFFRS